MLSSLRICSLLAWVVWKIGIRTPSRITVTTVVTTAARVGAPLRRRARSASCRKKIEARHQSSDPWSWPLVWPSPSGPTPISACIRRPNSVVDSSV